MKKGKVKVAIIDCGIDTDISHLMSYVTFKQSLKINAEGKVVKDNSMKVSHHHGTAIALIIKQLCDKVEFYDINIFDEDLSADGRVLLHSIEEAIKLKPDIIHLSLGTKKLRYILKLKKLIREANLNRIIIVSALNNDTSVAYPANLRGVIRVEGGKFEGVNEYTYHKGKFKAPFDLSCISGKEEVDYKKLIGNSMAAAYITGHICRLIDSRAEKLGTREILGLLKKNHEGVN